MKDNKLKKKIIKLHDYYGIEMNKWIPQARSKYFEELFAIIREYEKFKI